MDTICAFAFTSIVAFECRWVLAETMTMTMTLREGQWPGLTSVSEGVMTPHKRIWWCWNALHSWQGVQPGHSWRQCVVTEIKKKTVNTQAYAEANQCFTKYCVANAFIRCQIFTLRSASTATTAVFTEPTTRCLPLSNTCPILKASQDVRRSYSARVPRSSLARVHREFVHHIVEDEVDGQEEGQDDKREKMVSWERKVE